MLHITPCRNTISDRFPVASFVIRVPSNRVFEIACATDPTLFRGDRRAQRTPENFFTSRAGGLLRAPAGQATYLLPPEQLRRFAGQRRLYYAVGSYGDVRGAQPEFTVPPEQFERAPYIALSPDFTGRSLDRSRLRRTEGVDPRYGSAAAVLAWGGDVLRIPNAPAAVARQAPPAYDDGYPADLWSSRAQERDANDPRDPPDAGEADDVAAAQGEPSGFEDAPDLRVQQEAEAYGRRSIGAYGSALACRAAPNVTAPATHWPEPPGHEDAPALRRASPRHESFGGAAAVEPEGYEDAPALRRSPALQSFGGAATVEPEGYEDAPALRRSTALQSFGGAATAEPEGYEDAPALRRAPTAYGHAAPIERSEPPGAEDAPDLRRLGGAVRRYGDGTTAPSEPATPQPAAPVSAPVLPGVDAEFSDCLGADEEGELPSPAAAPLPIIEKFRIVQPIAAFQSGEAAYSASYADGELNDPTHSAYQRIHYGLSWGLMQFNQRGGALGRVLTACERRAPMVFRQVFGPERDKLLQTTTAASEAQRVEPVGGVPLWQEPWLTRFREAGKVPQFQAAQNEVAIEGYFDPNLAFAAALGFDTDRAMAMLYDRCVHMGNLAGRRFVVGAVTPLKDPTAIASALSALGHASVQDFQQSLGLAARPELGPKGHAALLAALRGLGAKSPVAVPALPQMLDALVQAAKGRRFEGRVAALRSSTLLSDTPRPVS